MDPDLAKKLFFEGAVLVILDVPEGTEFGIDYNSWTVGPKFKGVKMIPPGFHFVFYSAVSKEKEAAPRTGFFHFFKQKEIVVRRWDNSLEVISEESVTQEVHERIQGGLHDLDSSLGAYPYESLKKWVSLSNYVSESITTRVQPLNGYVSSVSEVHSEEQTEAAPVEAHGGGLAEGSSGKKEESGGMFAGVGYFTATNKQEHNKLTNVQDHHLEQKPESVLRFQPIPNKYPKDSTPAEVTHHCMDSSYALESMLKTCCEEELLGELQLAFLCFLQGQVYDAFEHWKLMVRLLCSSEDAMKSRSKLFSDFISVLHFQLKEIPEDFFVDIVSRSNFLTTTLQTFFSILEESKGRIDSSLVKRGLKFRDSLNKQFKWDFSSEPDEFAPTIVDT